MVLGLVLYLEDIIVKLPQELQFVCCRQASGIKLASTLQGAVSVVTGVVIGFIYSWELTLAILAFAPFLILGGTLQFKMLESNTGTSQGALEGAGKVGQVYPSFQPVVGHCLVIVLR